MGAGGADADGWLIPASERGRAAEMLSYRPRSWAYRAVFSRGSPAEVAAAGARLCSEYRWLWGWAVTAGIDPPRHLAINVGVYDQVFRGLRALRGAEATAAGEAAREAAGELLGYLDALLDWIRYDADVVPPKMPR